MATQQRRERERARRASLIVSAAREMAEAEGWDSVTIRKLADRIEYSQPVLYGHFAGRGAIVDAVALEGFEELAESMERARTSAEDGGELEAMAQAYLDFAAAKPAVFEAMFTLAEGLQFGDEALEPLKAGFASLYAVFAPLAGEGQDPETLTETGWAAIHGLATLNRDGRLRPGLQSQRLQILLQRFRGGSGA
ncbi:TetR/AcrR family transcriptional regulator [Glycomyces sp. TRM65418]|uniref:TetR/AcrR family transcriptional regulator n=1 Tax=Glycomyces sp. TRM65418 TaxID=2867006 RepID=UPI001CE6A6DE|nr:TetR/AcrR family transcriptional regulator [Glycomyces sp. TRM65418]MCC3765286.1 TetR/AcrR family transcriptional regulator [Glycomyces sp. TRM65418]QZD54905.1 TetR/AcrR family transcriptional regulator [Glycomyces sp. TRM65418]